MVWRGRCLVEAMADRALHVPQDQLSGASGNALAVEPALHHPRRMGKCRGLMASAGRRAATSRAAAARPSDRWRPGAGRPPRLPGQPVEGVLPGLRQSAAGGRNRRRRCCHDSARRRAARHARQMQQGGEQQHGLPRCRPSRARRPLTQAWRRQQACTRRGASCPHSWNPDGLPWQRSVSCPFPQPGCGRPATDQHRNRKTASAPNVTRQGRRALDAGRFDVNQRWLMYGLSTQARPGDASAGGSGRWLQRRIAAARLRYNMIGAQQFSSW